MIKTIGILRKIHLILPRHSLITIYKTFINPHLDYADVLCMCVCVCVCTEIHREGFICLDDLASQGTD